MRSLSGPGSVGRNPVAWAVAGAVALLALALLAAMQAPRDRARMIGVATSAPGAVFHSAGTAIASVMNSAGIPATVQAFASPNVYLHAVNSGQIAFGVSNAGDVRLAAAGEQHFEGRRLENLRAVAVLFPLRMAVYVREDSPVRTLDDLRGRRTPTGFAGQKSVLPLFEAVLATADLQVSDLHEVRVPNVVGGATAFIEGNADSFFFALGAAKVREADASAGGIRALSIPDTPENLAAIRRHWAAGYLSAVDPGPANTGVLEPIFTITHDAILVAGAGVPDETVYALVKILHEDRDALISAFGSFSLMEPDRMVADTDEVRWHPGALAYYREAGLLAGSADGAD